MMLKNNINKNKEATVISIRTHGWLLFATNSILGKDR